ncbi:MAG: RdgB/HAM1 family non-canonical purine NTP pyrophosphatase [Neisseriales bacterium]|nr:MAG: RdgB/HAM1 family non-canonical purine NTP pyrophosphatase [Neisseriales bacterium]
MKRIILASNNPHKIKECQALLAPLALQLIPQNQQHIPPADEPYSTFIENALHKARQASRITGLPALSDDSGLCVRALHGLPGIHSARFAGEPPSDAANNQLLIEKMRGVTKRDGYFYCMLTLVRYPDDPAPVIAEGIWFGQIATVLQGDKGFGYDPLFYLPHLKLTAAQLDPTNKNRLSHRAQAFKKLLAQSHLFLPVK